MRKRAPRIATDGTRALFQGAPSSAQAAGVAALLICESLILAITENSVLSIDEVRGALEDAAAAHRHAARRRGEQGAPAEVLHHIDRIKRTLDSIDGHGKR